VPIQNSEVAGLFNKVADLLEIEGENQFRVRAYRDAARTVGGHSRSVAEMVATVDRPWRPCRGLSIYRVFALSIGNIEVSRPGLEPGT
jgi:DNA polymerase/3'-5' exonuclease PolX